MKNIDLIREVTLAAADRWPTVLAGLHIDVPDSPRRHARARPVEVRIAFVSMMAAAAALSATSAALVMAST
jgi:hypothetical protein